MRAYWDGTPSKSGVEVIVEEDVILEMGIGGEFRMILEHRALAAFDTDS